MTSNGGLERKDSNWMLVQCLHTHRGDHNPHSSLKMVMSLGRGDEEKQKIDEEFGAGYELDP
ncbi:uncharacterized protein G2W53_039984 [Senna tora]|uniref:Uncharacterized protein n=1 Tax=Senna tora TaxID=362788 RepID=A0A834SRG7_9FABA|nr:uncharacterized protein G2W53_039984 [Senna tora]